MSEIRKIEKELEKSLKKQAQEGLAEVFQTLTCKAVAREIREGRNVTGNAEFGTRLCVHPKLGPLYNVETKQFHPQTDKARKLEEKFIRFVNVVLKNASFPEMKSDLLADLRRGDQEFKETVKKR